MNSTKTTYCGRCRALRWVEDWRERSHEMLAIVLGPCGHVIERTARLEWAIPGRRSDKSANRGRVHEVRAREQLATS